MSKVLAATFFLPQCNSEPSLERLASNAGLEDGMRGTSSDFERANVFGRWAGMSAHAHLNRRAFHEQVTIYFSMNQYYDLLLLQDAQDPNRTVPLSVVRAFRAACIALSPEVALLATLDHQSEPDWIDAQYQHISTLELRELLDQYIEITFVATHLFESLGPDLNGTTCFAESGYLIFAGQVPRGYDS